MDPSLIIRKYRERGIGALDSEERRILFKQLSPKERLELASSSLEQMQKPAQLSDFIPGARGEVNKEQPMPRLDLPSNEMQRQESLKRYDEGQQLKRAMEQKAKAEHEAKVQALGPLDQYPAMTYDPAAAEFLPPEKKKQLANRFMKTRGMLQKKTDKALTPEEE